MFNLLFEGSINFPCYSLTLSYVINYAEDEYRVETTVYQEEKNMGTGNISVSPSNIPPVNNNKRPMTFLEVHSDDKSYVLPLRKRFQYPAHIHHMVGVHMKKSCHMNFGNFISLLQRLF